MHPGAAAASFSQSRAFLGTAGASGAPISCFQKNSQAPCQRRLARPAHYTRIFGGLSSARLGAAAKTRAGRRAFPNPGGDSAQIGFRQNLEGQYPSRAFLTVLGHSFMGTESVMPTAFPYRALSRKPRKASGCLGFYRLREIL